MRIFWVATCLAAIAACGSGVPAETHIRMLATARSTCVRQSAFALSLVSDRGGKATPVAAASWFARHGGVAGIPRRGWRVASRRGHVATLQSGQVTLHVIEGPDHTWQVDSGRWCYRTTSPGRRG